MLEKVLQKVNRRKTYRGHFDFFVEQENTLSLMKNQQFLAFSKYSAEMPHGLSREGQDRRSWNSFEYDMMDSVKEAVTTSKSDLVIVPGGCTKYKYIQAPDVCWNKPFKELLVQNMVSGCLKACISTLRLVTPRTKIVQLVLESWSALSKEVIVESFKSCALNIANDESEDEIIHCFKPKDPCHAGPQQLKLQLSVLDNRSRDNPFENISDSDVEDAVDDLNVRSDDENDIKIEI